MPQGDEEWLAARCGKATGSRMGDMTSKTKTGDAASRANYKAELVVERITDPPFPHFVSQAMADGTAREPDGRVEYEFERGVTVTEVGFVPHPLIAMAGASPDGLVGSDGIIEIKSMQPAGHLEALLSGKISDSHKKQMQFGMAVTQRMWCDFIAYNPNFPPPYRIWIERVYRDEAMIKYLENATRDFLMEVDQAVADLRAKYERERAA